MRILRCVMNDIVEKIVSSCDRHVGWDVRKKVGQYVILLASTGKTEPQLLKFGAAYLKEIFEPDSRYSGC
ncbi:MAG: hypothetical protein QOE39_1750 [Bradyrhizobium sp.]|jgi:hypothetical protein|nr:hypothetical protein [Bradyrhizobium sp.]